MKKRIRGQGALEYLMTYGWAILVVMAIGVAMWQLGIFNLGGVTSTTSTGFARVKPLLPLTTMNTSGTFSSDFVNGAGAPITINAPISATSGGNTCTITAPTGDVNNAERFTLTGTCLGASGSRGDPYEIKLTISYNVSYGTSAVIHTDQGTIKGPLE